MTFIRSVRWAAALLVSLTVVACGGNDDGYGAIAVSTSTNRVAIVSGELTQSVANDEARDECDASDCAVVLQFEECGAASAGTIGSTLLIAVAQGGSAFDAQTAANNACTAQGAVGCGEIPNLAAECN